MNYNIIVFIFTYTFILLSAATSDPDPINILYIATHSTPQQLTPTPVLYVEILKESKTE
jgi:hypothetical protein